jgi:hypothetical protein
LLPASQKLSGDFAPNTQVVIGDAIATLGKSLAQSTCPTEMRAIACAIDKRLSDEADSDIAASIFRHHYNVKSGIK